MPHLSITGDHGTPFDFPLAPGATTVGRAPENDLVLDTDGVSRRHLRVTWDGAVCVVEDLGSKNGTLVNGRSGEGAREVAPGDLIAIPGWKLRFEGGGETVTRPMTPASTVGGAPAPGPTVVLRAETREVVVRGAVVRLPPKEYLALTLLHERAGKVVTKEDIALRVWPEYGGDVSDYNIHQVISRLRRELEVDPANPRVLITRPGFGYILLTG